MVEKGTEDKRREKNLISVVRAKISDLRTGAITVLILVVLALVGSLFAKYIMRKLMGVDIVVIIRTVSLGVIGLIIFVVAYIGLRVVGTKVNKYFRDKGF